jgi:hypothetical protein
MIHAIQPPHYHILVEGALDPQWSECLGGLAISVREGPGQPPLTVLAGPLQDQAALQGVLDTLFMLNLRLLHVQRRPPDAGAADLP